MSAALSFVVPSFVGPSSSLPLSGGAAAVEAALWASLPRRLRPLSPVSSLLAVVPRGRASAPVVLVSVSVVAGCVVARCGDGSVRRCRPSVASRAFGRPVSLASLVDRLNNFLGQPVRFVSADDWSPLEWFVAVGC